MEPVIVEIDATFFGRKVIQVDEFFYVDSQIDVGHQNFEMTDSKRTCLYKGCIYVVPGVTAEAFEHFPPQPEITQEELDAAPVIAEEDLLERAPYCQHAA